MIRQILSEYKSPRFDYLPPFTGGLAGYFSYDYFGYSEPSVRSDSKNDDSSKDLDLMLFDKVIAFDHVRQKIILMVNMSLTDPETSYNKAVLELEQLTELLKNGKKKPALPESFWELLPPCLTKKPSAAWLRKQSSHIREGDIFQIVLSNCFHAPFEGSLLQTYRILRTLNPSPYMFYFSGTDLEAAGAFSGNTGKAGKWSSPHLSSSWNPFPAEKMKKRIKNWRNSF